LDIDSSDDDGVVTGIHSIIPYQLSSDCKHALPRNEMRVLERKCWQE